MAQSPEDLRGKAAIVTGASSGIGMAVAEALHEKGVKLVICGQREARLKENAACLGGAEVVAGDLVEPGVAESLFERCLDAHGRCDIVINNAGYMVSGPADEINLEGVSRMVRVNVEAGFRMIYLAVRHFLKAGVGDLITTTSILGLKTRPLSGPYSGTKFALEALSESLRMELAGKNVRVACIEPGFVQTDLHREYKVNLAEARGLTEPVRSEDVARGVIFMLEQPRHVNAAGLILIPAADPI